jgi:hypothetical protein
VTTSSLARRVAAPRRRALTLERARAAELAVAGLVAVSAAVRAFAASGARVPRLFPDEYIYSALARGLAESGRLEIRGHAAHFPALLEPILTAPFWLGGDPAFAYRATLLMHAVAMSLAAVPVFLLARRLGLGDRVALVCALLAVTAPALVYTSYLTAGAVGYLLALTSVATFVRVLERPTRATQAALVVLSGLTALARLEYAVLPLVFVLAALVVERGSLRRVLRGYPIALGLFGLPLVALLLSGPHGVLGYYHGVASLAIRPASIAHWVAVDGALLALSLCAIAPGALIGVLAGLIRPRSRSEAAFCAVATFFGLGLLLEAALFASNGSERFQERYLIALAPLAAPAFALSLGRGRRGRALAAGAAGALLLYAVRVPVTGYVFGSGRQDSPFLTGIHWLEQQLGLSTADLLVAAVAGAGAVVAGLAAAWPRTWRLPAFAVAVTASILVSYATVSADRTSAWAARESYLPTDVRWVDSAHLGPVDVLVLPDTERAVVSEHLFWNQSLRNVLLFPHTAEPDVFASTRIHVLPDGRIRAGDRIVRSPLLVEEYAASATLAGATRVRTTPLSSLWRPNGIPRLSTLTVGRYFDGWLAGDSRITIWPGADGRVKGTLHLRLFLPAHVLAGVVLLRAPGMPARRVAVGSGGHVRVAIPVDASTTWTLTLRSTTYRTLTDGRDVSVQASRPVFDRTAALKTGPPAADRP